MQKKRAIPRNVFRIGRHQFDGLVDHSEALLASYWGVCDTYRLMGGLIYEDADRGRHYVPLREPGLFLSFARLRARGEPSEASIMRWVSRYGLLTLAGNRPWSPDDILADLDFGAPAQQPITVEDFRVEVARAHELLTLYTEIQARDVDAVRNRAARPQSSLDERFGKLFNSVEILPTKKITFVDRGMEEDDADLHLALSVLAKHVSDLISNVRLSLSFDPADSVIPATDGEYYIIGRPINQSLPMTIQTWRCPDLLSAIYLQFYLLLTDNRPMRRCENPPCSMPFPITRKNKRFCSDTCRSNARHYS
jgi:hypothetical protein